MKTKYIAKLNTLVRRITLTGSLFSSHLFEDPNDLFEKIYLKLSGKGIKVPRIRFPLLNVEAEELLDKGELSKSLRSFEASGLFGKLRARKVHRQLVELELPILTSASLSPRISQPNVLFYLNNSKPYTQSGYTERSHHLLKALSRFDISVLGVTRLAYPIVIGSFSYASTSRIDGVEYKRLLPWRLPSDKNEQIRLAVLMIVKEARDFNADILHTTTDYKNAIVVSRAAQILGIPWIYETRGELQKTWLSKRSNSLRASAVQSEYFQSADCKEFEAMSKAAAVVQLSDVSKNNAILRGVDPSKIVIVPNAVGTNEIGRSFDKESLRGELKLSRTDKLVGAITSVVQYEGLDDLIVAVSKVTDVHCVIVGDGEARKYLESLVDELEIDDRVSFVGKQPAEDIWKWYASIDCFVIPRKNQEVCRSVTPIKTLLAQANGVPVIASDLPAIREITGNNAIYVQPEAPQELATAIEKLFAADPSKVRELTTQAQEWVRTRTWEENAVRLRDLYMNGINS